MSDPGPGDRDEDAAGAAGDRDEGFSGSAADLPRPPRPRGAPPPVIDPRPYRWAIGIIGVALVTGAFVYQLATHGSATTGVPPGKPLHLFAAPLAATNLNGDPTTHPTCSESRHDQRALNVCLLAARGPLVLAFFVTRASVCERQVDALQTLAGRYPRVQFAAVAVGAGHAAAAAAVRAHGWTLPVAYDRDGVVQALYGVVACPMLELAARGGVVRYRLIGKRWTTAAALAPYVRGLL